MEWYNNEHRHSGIHYVTPNGRHCGKDKEILAARKELYEKAKAAHPERGSKNTRDWSYVEEEWLNPKQKKETKKKATAS